MSRALTRFAAAAGVLLSVDAALTDGKESPGLQGDFAVADGFAALLVGSGLELVQNADCSYTLRRVAQSEAVEPQQKAQEDLQTPSQKQPTVLPEMTVTASPLDDTSYNVPNASTATRTDTPIMETPVSIQVVPQQVLKDQQVVRLDRALENVSGVYANPPGSFNGAGDDIFQLRGFTTFDTFRNGMRFSDGASIEIAELDRIEVLKGPASILYGRIEPGGLINLVTKKPLTSSYYALQQQFGSFDFYRTTLDATGPLTQDDTLLYRLNLAYQNTNSFREFIDNEQVFAAPVLQWNISDRTQATIEVAYKHSRDPFLIGIPAIGNRPADLPRERNLAEPNNEVERDEIYAGFNWSHAFNDRWMLRHGFYADVTDTDSTQIFGPSLQPDNRTLTRIFIRQLGDNTNYNTTLDLTGKFGTWGLEHTLLLGSDYYNLRSVGSADVFSLPSIDIFNPVHGGSPGPLVFSFGSFKSTEKWYGFYLQDQVRLPKDVHLLAGFRYDNAKVRTASGEISDKAVTPRFGLLWQPIQELSIYGNYVENFGLPNIGTISAPLTAETAQQREVGLKTELFDGRFTGTAAYFDITKQNISIPDPTNPFSSVTVGEARNRGFELDVTGEILPGWNVIGAYAYIDSEITKDAAQEFDPNTDEVIGTNPGNTGHRFFNVPRHGGSLWTTYDLQQGNLRGLKFGGGVVARSQREGNNANDYQIPGYAVVT